MPTRKQKLQPRLSIADIPTVPYPCRPISPNRVLLPDGAKAYGSIKRLFAKIANVLKQLSLPETQASLLAIWIISTWVSDQLFSPPTLWISGPDVVRVMRLFEILRCFCRRGMVVPGLTASKLQFLPMSLRPTLLLCDPSLNVLKTLMQANFRGVLVPGSDGIARDLRCAKAIYTSTRDLPQPWASQTVHLPLSPLDDPARHASEEKLVKLEKLFQPLLLQYRLDHWQTVRDSRFAADVPPAARELANALGACVQTDDELTAKLPTLLSGLDNDPSSLQSGHRDHGGHMAPPTPAGYERGGDRAEDEGRIHSRDQYLLARCRGNPGILRGNSRQANRFTWPGSSAD